jgi:hypothetical protein
MKIKQIARPVAPGSVDRRRPGLGLLVIVVVCGGFWGGLALWLCN